MQGEATGDDTMRAVRFSEYGGPEVLHIVDVPEPTVDATTVVVELAAAGINPADSKRRSGSTPIPSMPSGTGREFAGSVIAVGADVTEFEVGDTVYGTGEGVLAERLAVAAPMLAHVPYGLDRITASTIPVAAQTAAVAVASQSLTSDDVVLVSAAAGGVGHIAVQLAVRTGARVIGTVSEANADLVRAWGAEPVAYGPGLADRLRAMAPTGLTAVLDHHGEETVTTALALGVPADRINSIAGVAERFGIRHVGRVGLDRAVVDRLARDVTNGRLEIRIVDTFRLDQVVEAYRTLDAGHVAGKLVITF